MSGERVDEAALRAIDRLNAEKKVWSFEVTNHLVLDGEVIVLARLTVDGVAKMSFGTATTSRELNGNPSSVGTGLKVAANDALARAARLFGFGLVADGFGPGPEREPSPTSLPPESRVTQKQLGAINGIARRRNIGRSELGELLLERFSKNALATLSKKEASELIGELSDANGHSSP